MVTVASHKLLLTPASLLEKRHEKDIVALAVQLCTEQVDVEQEDDTARFLGIHKEHDPKTGFLNMTQKGLIKQELKNLHLDVGTVNGKFTLSIGSILPNMCMESAPLSISTTAVWLVCFSIFLVTHTLKLLTLSPVLLDIRSTQSLCTNMPSSKLVAFRKLLLIRDFFMKLSEKLLKK
ncbi:hypothetical protein ACHAXS_000903 [Conticribra weissflogii]